MNRSREYYESELDFLVNKRQTDVLNDLLMAMNKYELEEVEEKTQVTLVIGYISSILFENIKIFEDITKRVFRGADYKYILKPLALTVIEAQPDSAFGQLFREMLKDEDTDKLYKETFGKEPHNGTNKEQ